MYHKCQFRKINWFFVYFQTFFYFCFKILAMIKIEIKDVKDGVLHTEFGNANLGGKYKNTVSFPLKWSKVKGAKSYAITLIDLEATGAMGIIFIHWVAANIKTNKLGWDFSFQNRDKIFQFENSLTNKATKYLLQALYNDHPNGVYFGPFPPDQDHNYELRVYALNVEDIFLTNPELKKMDLFYDDFLNLIANKVIDQGFTTFLYRAKTKMNQDYHLEQLNLSQKQLNAPLAKDQQNFFATEKIIDFAIFSDSFSKIGDDTYLLETKNVMNLSKEAQFQAEELVLKWNKLNDVKEYVIILYSTAENTTLGVSLVKWVKVGIKTSDFANDLIVSSQAKENVKISTSFASISLANISKAAQLDPKAFDSILNGYGLAYIPSLSNNQGNHLLKVYGLNQEIDWLQYQQELNRELNLADVYRKIKSKVIAKSEKVIKIKQY
ncbi:YbhB/YbcL family Raf kinase inhibitor-like protein [Mycoplasma hyorhinis]|nr:YbhB/YbcL family Raf kinase inhibitor-like protein [Mesomycoplasma hyorhinis]